jgi:hypothetical protein
MNKTKRRLNNTRNKSSRPSRRNFRSNNAHAINSVDSRRKSIKRFRRSRKGANGGDVFGYFKKQMGVPHKTETLNEMLLMLIKCLNNLKIKEDIAPIQKKQSDAVNAEMYGTAWVNAQKQKEESHNEWLKESGLDGVSTTKIPACNYYEVQKQIYDMGIAYLKANVVDSTGEYEKSFREKKQNLENYNVQNDPEIIFSKEKILTSSQELLEYVKTYLLPSLYRLNAIRISYKLRKMRDDENKGIFQTKIVTNSDDMNAKKLNQIIDHFEKGAGLESDEIEQLKKDSLQTPSSL